MRAHRLARLMVAAMTLTASLGCGLIPPGRGTSASGGAGGGQGGNGDAGHGGGGTVGSGGVVGNGGAGSGAASGGSSNANGGSLASGGSTATGGSSAGTGSGGATGGVAGSATGGTRAGGAGGSTGGGGTGGSTSSCALGPSFKWSSSDALMDPVSDGSHDLVAIRDPSVVSYNKRYVLYATVVSTTGSTTLEGVSFATWADAGNATVYYLDNGAAFSGSRSGPQVFSVAGQQKWYLVTQGNGPAYSTASDPSQAASWSKPTSFFSSTPAVVSQNAGSGPGWTDFWVICDSSNCHLFFANNNGYLFRSQTSLGSFPNGFGTPVVVMKGSGASDIYGGVSVYKVKGGSKYLLLAEAAGSNGHYIRAWTADALDGTWTALADSEASPFAGYSNTSFSGSAWTKDIAGGELLRDGYDETMTVNPCGLQYVYQGRNAYGTAAPPAYPWKIGLLTKSN